MKTHLIILWYSSNPREWSQNMLQSENQQLSVVSQSLTQIRNMAEYMHGEIQRLWILFFIRSCLSKSNKSKPPPPTPRANHSEQANCNTCSAFNQASSLHIQNMLVCFTSSSFFLNVLVSMHRWPVRLCLLWALCWCKSYRGSATLMAVFIWSTRRRKIA